MKNVVGPRIRELRREGDRTTTQEELVARLQAAGIDIDESALSRIENGKTQAMDFDVMARLCDALRCEPGDLIERKGKRRR